MIETKSCHDCKDDKPLVEYHKHAKTRDGLQIICKSCMAVRNRSWKATNPEKLAEYERNRPPRSPEVRRAQILRREYGIEAADYDALVEKQGGRCAICSEQPQPTPGRRLALYVDHCHNTDQVRGLLCHSCNLALGHMKDDVSRLRAAIAYLEEERTC